MRKKIALIATGCAATLMLGIGFSVGQTMAAEKEASCFRTESISGINAVYVKEGLEAREYGDGAQVSFKDGDTTKNVVYSGTDNEAILDSVIKTEQAGGFESASISYTRNDGEKDSFVIYADTPGINFEEDGKAYLTRINKGYFGNTADSLEYTSDADVLAFVRS